MNSPCETTREKIADFVLGILSSDESNALTEHISRCPECRKYAQALQDEKRSLVQLGEALDRDMKAREDKVIEALNQSVQSKRAKPLPIWRIIMKSRITKLAAAAAVVIAISMVGWLNSYNRPSNGMKSLTYFSYISEARAAEQKLFYQDGITHIVNEIVVFPTSGDIALGQEKESDQQANKFLGYKWVPMCSVQASGRLRFNQLQLPAAGTEPYSIVDESWYDSATGKFVRVLRYDEEVFFANSYDGKFVYSLETAPDGTPRLIKEQVTDDFSPPQNPAEFLGIAAGLQSDIEEETVAPVQEVSRGTLADGAPVRIVKAGFTDLSGELIAYWLFKAREDDGTIAEMEFIIADEPQLLIRRVSSKAVAAPSVSWSLAELPEEVAGGQETVKPVVKQDMVILNVSVRHMVEVADFETYIFAPNPPWAGHREIADCVDPPNPSHRMFIIAYRADDGRHVVLVQSHTYNKTLGNLARKGQLVYTSPDGFKVWGGGPDKWYSGILLSSARFTIKDPPSDDRIGYVLESPAGTFPSLAVNGALTDEELHSVIDSLIPAREYQGE
jgi:hypothetical protein